MMRSALVLVLATLITASDSPPKLLVILLEGFRLDYVGSHRGFHHLGLKGTRAVYLQPNFPTDFATNMYSIMTGLYPESHGMVGDVMLDVNTNTTFNIRDTQSPMWWEHGDPLWISATRQGKRTALFDWPGCQLVIRGVRGTHCNPDHPRSDTVEDFSTHVETAVKLFREDDADFVGIHVSTLDVIAHKLGPHSVVVEEQVAKVVDIIAGLQHQLEANWYKGNPKVPLTDVVNLMVVSDHGIAGVSPEKNINVTAVLDMDDVHAYITTGTSLYIWPKKGAENQVYDRLRQVKHSERLSVYKKDQLPAEWHLKGSAYVAPLVAIADINWRITTPNHKAMGLRTHAHVEVNEGAHGYMANNSDMRAIFFARGPNFKPNTTLPAISNVNLYQIMCAVLGIDASVHNGTWDDVSSVLIGVSPPGLYHRHSHIPRAIVALIVVAAVFATISIACGVYCQRDSIKRAFTTGVHKWHPVDDDWS